MGNSGTGMTRCHLYFFNFTPVHVFQMFSRKLADKRGQGDGFNPRVCAAMGRGSYGYIEVLQQRTSWI